MKIDPRTVKGWGIDADPENDPTYPMRNRENEEWKGYDWPRPEQQPVDVEVLHTVERPNTSATFGTSTPPSGLSGMIRRQAYKFSESSYGRWLPLILADRVDMVEGVLQDIAQGVVPNIIHEKGLSADWKHDRANLITKVAVGALVATAVVTLFSTRNPRRRW